jgi:hypothetical protein
VLFSPLAHGEPAIDVATKAWLAPLPPSTRRLLLATPHGLLLNELSTAPASIVTPLLTQCARVASLCSVDFDSAFSKLLVYFSRLVVAMDGYCNAALAASSDAVSGSRTGLHHAVTRLVAAVACTHTLSRP